MPIKSLSRLGFFSVETTKHQHFLILFNLIVSILISDHIEGAEIRVGNNNEAFNVNPLFAVVPDNLDGNYPQIYDGDSALMGRYVSIQVQQGGIPLELSIGDVHVFGYRSNKGKCMFP